MAYHLGQTALKSYFLSIHVLKPIDIEEGMYALKRPKLRLLIHLLGMMSHSHLRLIIFLNIPQIQGLSEIMAFLKLLVLGNESTIGAQICGEISI